MPDWAFMSLLAYYEVGEPVRVSELPAEYHGACEGLAGWSGQTYTIALDADLAPAALLSAFYHELGHLRLGHVSKAVPSLFLPWPPAIQQTITDLRRGQEAHAEEWGTAKVAQIPPAWRTWLMQRCAGP